MRYQGGGVYGFFLAVLGYSPSQYAYGHSSKIRGQETNGIVRGVDQTLALPQVSSFRIKTTKRFLSLRHLHGVGLVLLVKHVIVTVCLSSVVSRRRLEEIHYHSFVSTFFGRFLPVPVGEICRYSKQSKNKKAPINRGGQLTL